MKINIFILGVQKSQKLKINKKPKINKIFILEGWILLKTLL